MTSETKQYGIVIPNFGRPLFIYRTKEYPDGIGVIEVCTTKEIAIQTAEEQIQGTDMKYEIVEVSTDDFIAKIGESTISYPWIKGKTTSLLPFIMPMLMGYYPEETHWLKDKLANLD